MKHQQEALEYLAERDSAGVFFEMGLGKTLVMLEHIKRLKESGKNPFPCLIVAPLSVLSVWEKEIEKFNYGFSTQKIVGSYRERVNILQNTNADVYIVNYEGVRVIGSPKFIEKKFKSIILDESHRIKNRTAQQTKLLMEIGESIKHKYILTGTPVTKSPEDIWTQVNFINSNLLNNFWSFRGRHIDFKHKTVRSPNGLREIKVPFRYKNLKELEEKLATVSIRKTKQECLDLPEKIYKKIYCPLSKEQNKHYHQLKNSLATLLENDIVNVSTASSLMQKLQQVCQGFIYNEEDTRYFKSGKFDMLVDLLKDLEEEKIILFAWYEADIKLLYKSLKDKYNVLLYDGSEQERSKIVDKFQNSDKPTIFLAQLKKAEVGITLTEANHVIYYGNSWSYETRKQSEDRAHRTGQKKNVVYYDLVVPNTVDELVTDALVMKEQVADKITGDSKRLAKLVLEAA